MPSRSESIVAAETPSFFSRGATSPSSCDQQGIQQMFGLKLSAVQALSPSLGGLQSLLRLYCEFFQTHGSSFPLSRSSFPLKMSLSGEREGNMDSIHPALLHADRNFSRPDLRFLRNRYHQHAIFVFGIDLFRIHSIRKPERTGK